MQVMLQAAPLQARNAGAQGVATADIIEPLTIIARNDLDFGGITVSPVQDGAVRIDAASGGAIYSGSARPVCLTAGNCTTRPALFAVRGEKNRDFRVTLPSGAIARAANGSGPDLAVSGLTSASENRPGANAGGTLDGAGIDSIRIGGKLGIPASTPPGKYLAEISLVVTYE